MRKTLFAMLGLVALGLWALPALAAVSVDPLKNPPKAHEPIPLENRAGIWQQRLGGNYQGTLSGTLIKQSQLGTTSFFLYPGACQDRQNGVPPGLGTWGPRPDPQADSLNGYTAGTTGPYSTADQSVSEILWHVADNALCTAGTNCPPQFVTGSTRMLWCGKFDANFISAKFGYPNLTFQILYFDTGTHAANYNFVLSYRNNEEQNYDYMYMIGGGDGLRDPVGNTRPTIDHVIADGSSGNVKLLVQWTGSVSPGNTNATGANTTASPPAVQVLGAGDQAETSVLGASYVVEAQHRAIYIVFKSDCLFSTEDGSWKASRGQQIDNVSVSDNGALYTDEAPPLIAGQPTPDTGPGVTPGGGIVLKGPSALPTISARVGAGIGTLWQLVHGSNLPTPDVCTPKNETGGNTNPDLIFEGGNASTFHTIPNQFNSIVECTFPIPVGTASVLALWDEYLDLPRFQGYVQYAEFRIHKDGAWGNWENTSPGGGVTTGGRQSWGPDGDELAAATQADTVQIRYNMQCIPFFAADHNNCGDVTYGILYDNFALQITQGVPAPIFGVFVGAIAQSMFVDGTIASPGNCLPATVAAGQCWPGVRGSDIGTAAAVHDNFNSPLGDSITLGVVTGLRKNGKGTNWHHAFDKGKNFGLTIEHTNPNFVAAFDKPRIIFRMFDPTSKQWSPFDSSELDVNNLSIAAGDTVITDSEYRVNWPPRDKVGTSIPPASGAWPGSITPLGGSPKTLYSQLNFMPRGSRIQYYWKGVDLNGGRSYQFSSDALAREVGDVLPTLPGSTNKAPDIIEFDVLPGVYPLGDAGSQLGSSNVTPLLDLDGSYSRWNFGAHATVQALNALGVRADRYRTLQGLEEGGHIGGHEFFGTRAGRLSNYFPNMDEYAIKALLASSYRIMIESSHTSTSVVDEESDSKLIKQWWLSDTGVDGGDRCIFASGDDFFSALLAVGGVPHPNEGDMARDVFGVAQAANQWNGGASVQFPAVTDLFADPLSGPGLGGTPGGYKYIVDGGCPAPNRFDALTKVGAGTANSATYPTFASVTNVAGVSNMIAAFDQGAQDHDRNKALGYGFSIQFIRQGGNNLVDTRAQVLYKFLTSCRGPRTATDTASCWPCPTPANKYGNWATLTGFQQSTFGPLYALQDNTKVLSSVDPIAGAPGVNRLQGNFPNPFNPETAIRFSSARAGRVDVRIFNVAGRLVQTISKNVTQGVNEVRWNGKSSDGANLASGVYFVKVKYPDGTESTNGLKVAIVR